MELTRRDALAALAAAGITGGAAFHYGSDEKSGGNSDGIVETTTSLAPILYPSEVTDAEEFVRTYVTGRIEDDEEYRAAMAAAVAGLDSYANEEYESPFRDLSPEQGEKLLTDIGLDRIDPDPDGSDRSQIRYYLVNELLYALFSSPTGGELVGTENPPGHPGGLEAYQGGAQ